MYQAMPYSGIVKPSLAKRGKASGVCLDSRLRDRVDERNIWVVDNMLRRSDSAQPELLPLFLFIHHAYSTGIVDHLKLER